MTNSSILREELAKHDLTVSASVCYNCSTCVNSCPVSRITEGRYNPRKIIQLANSEYEDKLYVNLEPNTWECTMCELCHEDCPQGVNLHEILLLVKNVISKEYECPKHHLAEAESLTEFGKAIPSSRSIERRREQLGLPEVKETDVQEVCKLIQMSTIAEYGLEPQCPEMKKRLEERKKKKAKRKKLRKERLQKEENDNE